MSGPGEPQGNPFDARAAEWDEPHKIERAARVAPAIIERTTPGGRWLDYGAGTGLLGLALLGHADEVVLADSSTGMLQTSRAKISAAGLADRVSAIDLDLTRQDADPAGFAGVVSLLVLHHIHDAAALVGALTRLVRPGGWLAICDLDADDGFYHHGHGVRPEHDGFDRQDVAGWMGRAGLVDLDLSTPWVDRRDDREFGLFLAVGRRPAS